MPTDTALLPPDPSVPGLYYISYNGGVARVCEWSPDARGTGGWIAVDGRICSPEHVGAWGYTLVSPHPIPGPAALDEIYALATHPGDPTHPASPFALGYHAGMGYLAEKLRAALKTKETT